MMAQQKNVWGKEREGEKEKADQKPGRSSGHYYITILTFDLW